MLAYEDPRHAARSRAALLAARHVAHSSATDATTTSQLGAGSFTSTDEGIATDLLHASRRAHGDESFGTAAASSWHQWFAPSTTTPNIPDRSEASTMFACVFVEPDRSGQDALLRRYSDALLPPGHKRLEGTFGPTFGNSAPSAIRADGERSKALADSYRAAVELADELAAADEAEPPDPNIWAFALAALTLLQSVTSAPVPLMTPLQMGGISAEWHDRGLNIELRFRGLGDVFAFIEDARGEIMEFKARDPTLARAAIALRSLVHRAS